MESAKRCCERCWRCCGVPEDEVDIAKALAVLEVPSEDRITQLLADIEQTLEKGGDAEKVPMSDEVQKYASHLQKHLNKVILGAQISKDALNALGMLHWVGAGLTIIAMGLNMTLKTLDNKEQCSHIMQKSLDIWKKVMKPVLETKGLASDLMGESISIIIEGYLYCRNLLNSRTWKRFICASNHEKELEMWNKKLEEFLSMANAVMNVDLIRQISPAPPATTRTFATTLVGLEERKRKVMELLNLEDKEETRVVVLYGMGGVGKSTLAEVVYKQVSVSRERRRCRIELGEKPSKEHTTSLQRQMVENLLGESFNLVERDPDTIRQKLHQLLLSEEEEPFFIYIDNVLQSEDLEGFLSLDCELIKLPKGSRFLVTTRDRAVCTKIFQRNSGFEVKEFPVNLMNDRDAKKLLFLHALGKEEPSSEEVQRYDDGQGLIQEMVSSICGNLPLALRVLGRSLFDNKSVHSWRKKYDDLKNSGKLEQEKQIISVLKSSYDTLNPQTQIAFLMACVCFYDSPYKIFRDVVESILPKATTTRLFELGLLERHSSASIKGKGVRAFIKMHDLVRNLGFQMAVAMKCAPTKMLTCKEDFLDIDINDESWSEMKWLRVPALEDGIEAQLLEKCRELEVIVLDTHVNGHFGNPPQHLKVFWSTASSLPSEVLGKLKELAYLDVEDPFIEEFPVAPATRRLQVLSSFSGESIPKEAIDLHKTTLRKLHCKGTAELSNYFCEEMTKLQWLGLDDFQGQSFPEEMGRLKSLEWLGISSSTIQELPQSLAHLKKLQTLVLELQNLKEIPSGVLGEMKELARLHLHGLERVTSMPMEDIGKLASLEGLELELPSVERLTDDAGVSLKLEKLKFFCLKCEMMSSLEGVRLSCPSLECLHLHLTRLQVLPSKFITGSTNLRSLFIKGCGSLQELSAETELLWAVESLAIDECPALKAIPELGLMKSVESLALVDCPGVRELPGDLDDQKAASMRFLACDTHLLPPQFMSLPTVLPYSPGDWRAQQQLDAFYYESFIPVSYITSLAV